jgi:Flp pilus assembly protein TadG
MKYAPPTTRRPRRAERGQSLTEFACVLLPFLLVVFTIIEFGRAWAVKQAVTNAAREGARVLISPYGAGMAFADLSEAETAAIATAQDYLTSAGLSADGTVAQIVFIRQTIDADGNVTTSPLTGDIARGERVGMQVNYKFDTVLPVLLLHASSPIGISATSVMQHE